MGVALAAAAKEAPTGAHLVVTSKIWGVPELQVRVAADDYRRFFDYMNDPTVARRHSFVLQEFSSAEVVSAMPHSSARFTGSLENTTDYLLKNLGTNDVVIVMSAGDADQISTNVLKGLKA